MTINLKSLKTVIDLAVRKRDGAAEGVARAQNELAAARMQMEQLMAYAHEGEAKWAERSAAGVSPVLVHHNQQFMAKIQNARDFQTNVLSQREQQLAQARQGLALTERELATLKKVEERTRQAIQQARNKAEQKLNDDMAMTMLAHQRRIAAEEAES